MDGKRPSIIIQTKSPLLAQQRNERSRKERLFKRNLLLFVGSLKKDKTRQHLQSIANNHNDNNKKKRLEKEKEQLSVEAVTTNSMLAITTSFITKHKLPLKKKKRERATTRQ